MANLDKFFEPVTTLTDRPQLVAQTKPMAWVLTRTSLKRDVKQISHLPTKARSGSYAGSRPSFLRSPHGRSVESKRVLTIPAATTGALGMVQGEVCCQQ